MKNGFLHITIAVLMIIFAPMAVSAMEYQHKIEVKDMAFSWSVDDQKISVQLTAKTTGWVGIGFGPEKAMQGANIIIGAVKGEKFKVEDHYGDRKRGHSSDEKLGGKNDVMDAAGDEKDGVTTISFSIPLKTDDKWDKTIVADQPMKIMLAYGSGKDSFKTRHPYRTVLEVNLSTGENKKIK